jgi:hypothetical protein
MGSSYEQIREAISSNLKREYRNAIAGIATGLQKVGNLTLSC